MLPFPVDPKRTQTKHTKNFKNVLLIQSPSRILHAPARSGLLSKLILATISIHIFCELDFN